MGLLGGRAFVVDESADESRTRDISPSGPNSVAISAISWRPGRDLDLDEWAQHGKRLGAIGRGVAWWIGDWVNYGNTTFGEKYVRAANVTGYDVKSLMNMASVAGKFPLSRRRENLSWSHHAEVAGLTPEIGDQWLLVADARRLSVHALRDELRSWRARTKQARTVNGQRDTNRKTNNGERSGEVWEPSIQVRVDEPGDLPVEDPVSGVVVDRARCPQCGFVLSAEPP